MVLKVHRMGPVGVQSDQLGFRVHEVGRGDGLLGDLIHAGEQVGQNRLALRVGLDLIHAVAVRGLHQKHRVGNRLPGIGVPLVDHEVGAALVLDGDRGCLAGEQLHVVLSQVKDVVRHGGGLLHGVHARLQVGDVDLTVLVGNTVQVAAPILDPGDAEMHPRQGRAVRADLNEPQGRLGGVGEHEIGVFIGIDLYHTDSVVNEIAVRGLQLPDLIGAGLQFGQVDLPVFIGGELLPVAATHQLELKADVGDGLHGHAVHLDEVDTRLSVVEEDQLLDPIPRLQLDLLGHGLHNMFIVGGHLLDQVGAGVQIHQQDLAQLSGGEVPQQLTVPPDSEGHAGHGLLGDPVILLDPQAGQLLVGEGHGGGLPGHHGDCLDSLRVRDPALDAGDLPDLIGPRQEAGELDSAAGLRGAAVGPAALDMLDLYLHTGKALTGVAEFLHPEVPVGLVLEGDGGRLTLPDRHVLRVVLAEQVVLWGNPLINGVIARNGLRDLDLAVGVGGEAPDGVAVRPHDLKDSAAEGDLRSGLQLNDPQPAGGGFLRGAGLLGLFRRRRPAVGAVGVRLHGDQGVCVAHIVLDVPVLVHLRAGGVEDGVLVAVAGEGQLYAAALPLNGLRGVEDLELAGEAALRRLHAVDAGDVIAAQSHDPGPLGHRTGVRKGDVDHAAIHPRLAGHGEELLVILLALESHGIRLLLVRDRRDLGGQDLVPVHAVCVDELGGGQDPACRRLVRGGVDREVRDVPVGQQVAPEGHLCGVVRLVLTGQAQTLQAAGGVSAGHDPHDLRVRGTLVGQVFDPRPGGHRLGHAGGVGIHAVGRDTDRLALGVDVVVVGKHLGPHTAVDGEIAHLRPVVVDLHLAQGLLLAGRRQRDSGQQSHH